MENAPRIVFILMFYPTSSHQLIEISFLVLVSRTTYDVLSSGNWKQAINVEINALEKNKMWELVILLKAKEIIGFMNT